jgi:hypothetical protein
MGRPSFCVNHREFNAGVVRRFSGRERLGRIQTSAGTGWFLLREKGKWQSVALLHQPGNGGSESNLSSETPQLIPCTSKSFPESERPFDS